MRQTPLDPASPHGEWPYPDHQVLPPQTALYQPEPAAARSGPRKAKKRWPLVLAASAVSLFVGVGLGSTSPRPSETASAVPAPVTETVQAPASTVTETVTRTVTETATVTAEAPAPAAAEPVAASGGPLRSFSDGTYEVGTGDGQVAPGKYRSPGDGGMCYWARLKHNDGAFGDIIANNLGQGQMILNVKASDGYVEIRHCTFTKAA